MANQTRIEKAENVIAELLSACQEALANVNPLHEGVKWTLEQAIAEAERFIREGVIDAGERIGGGDPAAPRK